MKFAIALLLSCASLCANTNHFFSTLKLESGEVLTNATFSSALGSRVTFFFDSGPPRAFNVEIVPTNALARLGISRDQAIRKQADIDAAKQRNLQQYQSQAAMTGRQMEEWRRQQQAVARIREVEDKKARIEAERLEREAIRFEQQSKEQEAIIRERNAYTDYLKRIR